MSPRRGHWQHYAHLLRPLAPDEGQWRHAGSTRPLLVLARTNHPFAGSKSGFPCSRRTNNTAARGANHLIRPGQAKKAVARGKTPLPCPGRGGNRRKKGANSPAHPQSIHRLPDTSQKAASESLTASGRDDRGRTDDLLNVTQAL